jgi:peptide/nickel transport system substrate-binding protein
MNTRRLTLTIFTLLLSVTVVAACAAPAAPPTTAPVETPAQTPAETPAEAPTPPASPTVAEGPKTGGTLVVGMVSEAMSLDPGVGIDMGSATLMASIYEGLVRFKDGTLDVEPALATSWEVSDDALEYTFHLRQDVLFHDGTPFNAEAVKFHFERTLDENHPYYFTGPFPEQTFFFGALDHVEVVDDYTVKMVLAEPYGPFLGNLTAMTGGIASPTAIKEWEAEFGRHPVGTGPFKFVSWEPTQRIVLERNDDYWGGAPYLDGVVFRPITEAQVRYTELAAGAVDLIMDLPPDNIGDVESSPELQLLQQDTPHVWWLTLNTHLAPLDDVRVRQAVNYAVNKVAIVHDVLAGTGRVATQPIPPALSWAYSDEVQGYPYDPDKAMDLLKEAGYDPGVELVFWVPESGSGMQSPKAMAEAISADLAAVGITTRMEVMEWGTYVDEYYNGLGDRAHMAEMSWNLMNGDPDLVMNMCFPSQFCPPNGWNAGCYQNEEVDDLVSLAAQSADREERARLYDQATRIIVEEAPWLFVDNMLQTAAATADLNGFILQPFFHLRFNNAWLDR